MKKLLFLILLCAALTANAVTSYGFKVGGMDVNSDNYANIVPDDMSKGSISYNPTTNTVTFTGVTMYRDGSGERVLHNTGNSGLIVKFVGANMIMSEQASTMRFEVNTIITTDFNSDGETVITGGSQEAIYVSNSCTLSFNDIYGSFYVRGKSGVPIGGTGNESIIISNAEVHVTSGYNTSDDQTVLANINSLYAYNNSTLYLTGSKTKPTINNLKHFYTQAYIGINTPATATYSSSQKTIVDANGNPVTGSISISYMIPINATTFPDEAFRNYVLSNVDKEGHTGFLNSPEISRYGYRLSMGGLGIKDITGIEHFARSVRIINCSGNQLTSLSLNKFAKLQELICSGNGLTALNLSNCPKLEELLCSYNNLSTLDVSNVSLKNLDCSNNVLTTIDVSNNDNLTEFSCHGNHIKGAGLDALIDHLPMLTGSDGRRIFFVNHKNSDEGNECDKSQVNAASNKQWTLCHVLKKADNTGAWIPTEECVNYDLLLAGVRIGSCMNDNHDDIIPGVSGTWSYNGMTNVLTLSNATIAPSKTAAIRVGYALPGIKIMLDGDNTINFTSNSKIAITIDNCDGAVIEGPGTLNINNAGSALYIDSGPGTDDHRMTIRDCEINVNDPTTYSPAGTSIQDDSGSANLTIENATVRLARGYISTGYDLQLVNCFINKPAGGIVDRGSVCSANGNSYFTGEIEILPKAGVQGDVNGDGVVSGADVTALYNNLLENVPCGGDGDVNGDGVISGADVTALYNILLN